jgi:hypothetical protein
VADGSALMVQPSEALVRYRRTGGRPPSDDEALDVADDGSFTARRTVAGARVGTFAGRLASGRVEALRKAVDAARDANDVQVTTPLDGATEVLEASGHISRTGSNERPTGPWKALVETVRSMLDEDAFADPLAAIELTATSREAALTQAGTAPVEIDLGSVTVRVVRIDAAGLVLGRWQARLGDAGDEDSGEPPPAWTSAAAGWQATLPFSHGLELAGGDWLQVWVFATIRDAAGDGGERAARLFVAVPG